jgi:hypothetical protein
VPTGFVIDPLGECHVGVTLAGLHGCLLVVLTDLLCCNGVADLWTRPDAAGWQTVPQKVLASRDSPHDR